MKLRFFGNVLGFLTLLLNSLGSVSDLVTPILQIVDAIKQAVDQGNGKKAAKPTVKNLVAHLPKQQASKLTTALPSVIHSLGLGFDGKLGGDEMVKALTDYLAKHPEQRSFVYAKLGSNIFRELEPKTSEAEADTLIQIGYLNSKINGAPLAVASDGQDTEGEASNQEGEGANAGNEGDQPPV